MTVAHLFISPQHNFFGHHGKPPGDETMVEVDCVECVAGKGLRGDRFFGFKDGYKGQATFFSLETYERLCEELQVTHRDSSVFRRNIIVSGVDLNSLIGEEFEVQGVRFHGTQECSPCQWMNHAFAEGAEAALKDHGGLRARILTDGVLRRGS
jgi:MOSC domain-containing protein YiiM